MATVKDWLYQPVRPRTRLRLLLGAAITGVSSAVLARQITELEQRIEKLEARPAEMSDVN